MKKRLGATPQMCGIVGHAGRTPLELGPGVAALRHRGPDDEGYFFSENSDIALVQG